MIRGQIFKIGVELVFTFVISIIWLDIIGSREEETNRLMSINNEITLKETINNKNLYLINDNSDVNGLENNIITITNNKNEDTSCNLIMLIDKESLVDISYLRFKINNEVKYLDNIKYTLTDIESVTLIYLVVLYYIGIHNYIKLTMFIEL